MATARRSKSDFGAAAMDPTILELTLGNGTTVQVPTREAKDHENGREVTVHLPVWDGFRACSRCGGDCTREGHVIGGWLPHHQRRGETWYTTAQCCPDCVWGAFRHRCTRAPFAVAFAGCTAQDLAQLGSELKVGVPTLRAAVDRVPIPDAQTRLMRGIEELEVRERYRGTGASEPTEDAIGVGF